MSKPSLQKKNRGSIFLEFELANYNVAVHDVSHYTTVTSPTGVFVYPT